MSYCTSASRPSISLSVRRSVEPWPSEACGDKGPRETEPWPSTRGPGSAPHRQPGPATRSRPRARSGSARLCGPAARGGLRGGAAAGTGGGCAPAPQGAGRPVGTQRCGPVSRTGKQGAEVRTCGWTQATTSTDGSQGRGLGDKPWPPPTTCSLGFCICGVGASGPRLTEVASVGGGHRAGRTRWTRRWEPPAPGTGSPRARGRGSAAWAPASSWRVREHGGERGQTLATERQRDPSGEQQARAKPVTERCARAELQPPGARRRGWARRPLTRCPGPGEAGAQAEGAGVGTGAGSLWAPALQEAPLGTGRGSESPLGPRGARAGRRLHLPPLPVG